MKETIFVILGVITLIFILSLVMAIPVMYLWNWLIPDIFSLRELTYWESWGILILTGFLFRNINTNSK